MKKSIAFFLALISFSLQAQWMSSNLSVRKPTVPNTYNFTYKGVIQKFIVPNRVTSIQVNAIGAKGGTGAGGQAGGAGANITTTLNVTPGQVLYIVVGGFPGQSNIPKYGFGGVGGIANNTANNGGAGGGLSGIFNSNVPTNANALVIAGGGGGGSGLPSAENYTGGAAANTITGISSRGNQANQIYLTNGRHQYGYAATTTLVGVGGYAYDNPGVNDGHDGNGINGGDGGLGTGWPGGGGGGAGYFGGGGAAGGWSAGGGGAGGSTKTTSGHNSFGNPNTTGDGSVSITCLTNSSLVLHLDAGNPASYSGSGTTWNDLSGNGSHVTLTNTTYDTVNGGSIIFNGTSSYADFTANIGATNVVTIEMWVKTISLKTPGGAMYFGFDKYDAWTRNGNIGYNTANSDLYGVPTSQVDFLGVVGNWRHLVFVMYSGNVANNKIYVNGVSQTLGQQISGYDYVSAKAVFNSGEGRIGSWRSDLSWLINMQIASFKVYNRGLTAQEVANNLKVSRNRFYTENDGLTANTASTSAYQIKQDYPNSPDGFYWIKNDNINGGVPIKIYADMTTEGGGWTLLLKNSSNAGWDYNNSMALNTTSIPFTTNADVISTSTANYSIIGWADYIKKSNSGFQYMIDAGSRRNFGGIWTANSAYSFISTSNGNTNITEDVKYGTWNYVADNNGMALRMPWRSQNAGSGAGFLTLSSGTGNWWGTLVSNNSYYNPAPWISDAGGGTANQNPGIIWYWVR
ncbi:fibrinogen-like YCDxxxxGGGW domain-containing protein [Aquirufa antheringensis]